MDVYACDVCGYYYDPECGDEESNISPGTRFAKLPTDWICPECGAGKKEFYKIEDDFEEEELVFDYEDEAY